MAVRITNPTNQYRAHYTGKSRVMDCLLTRLGGVSGACVVGACILATAAWASLWFDRREMGLTNSCDTGGGDINATTQATVILRETPMHLRGISHDGAIPSVLDDSFWQEVVRVPPERVDASMLMHLQSLLGPAATLTQAAGKSGAKDRVGISSILLSEEESRRCFGNSLLLRTAEGIRARTAEPRGVLRGAEAHRDQLLAHCGCMGLSIATSVKCAGHQGTIADMVRESLEHFDIHQKELEWTTLAYLHYAPHVKNWQDRFGTNHSFNEIAQELLSRPFIGASCNGIHNLIALSAIVEADRLHAIVSPDIRSRIIDRLRRAIAVVIETQDREGSWGAVCIYRMPGSRWPNPASQEPVIEDNKGVKQSITSHLVLWINTLPSEVSCPAGVKRAGIDWLCKSIADLSPEQYWKDYCTNTHVLNAICQSGQRN